MISKTTKTLLIAAAIFVLAAWFAGCAATGRKAKTEEPPGQTTLLPKALEGAPPFIPHDVEADMECLDCHRLGENDAAITPHPERVNCIQCHIPQNTEIKPFVENTF